MNLKIISLIKYAFLFNCFNNIVANENITLDNAPEEEIKTPEDHFHGVYSECIMSFSYTCIQRKTLKYLIELEKQNDYPVLGKYVSFIKIDKPFKNDSFEEDRLSTSSELSDKINKKVDEFFDTHILRVRYGSDSKEDINIGKVVDIVEGRKKNKGDSGDSSKKKMMMMAMMFMKMKMMMVMPAMMGMMGLLSLKGVLLGGLSLLISKILLIMKLMQGGGGKGQMGGAHGGAEPGWMMGGGGGGWMNAGGQDQGGSGGGSGGGYNSHGEWQNSRSGKEYLRSPHHYHPEPTFQRRKRDLMSILNPNESEARGKKKKKKQQQQQETLSSYIQDWNSIIDDNLWD